ncbi:hypothetical protein BGZ51_004163 [Haplosporangium sp. Z 767]|nr:hypothetical protein BGZ51_004163 [Haplosporangium sp. Z 767]
MTDSEREAWDRVKGLLREVQEKDRQLKDSMNLLMDVQRQLQESVHKFEDFKSDFEIPAMSLVRIDKHKQKHSKKLSMAERRAVKHLHEACVLEKLNRKYVAAGSSPKTISDVLDEKDLIDLRDEVRNVALRLAGLLYPYVSKKSPGKDSIPHVILPAPIVPIANSALCSTGYHEFTRKVASVTPKLSLHSFALGAMGVFEVFYAKGGMFNVNDASGEILTIGVRATLPENKLCSELSSTWRD